MLVARTRALAEDAAELVEIEWQELPAVTDKVTALDPNTPYFTLTLATISRSARRSIPEASMRRSNPPTSL